MPCIQICHNTCWPSMAGSSPPAYYLCLSERRAAVAPMHPGMRHQVPILGADLGFSLPQQGLLLASFCTGPPGALGNAAAAYFVWAPYRKW